MGAIATATDLNGDGTLDLHIGFSGGGAVILLGISDLDEVTIKNVATADYLLG